MTTLISSVQSRLHATLSMVTGHQACDLESDMFLESDLGIDSIKMIELSQTLLQLVPETRREQFMLEVPTDRVMEAQTVAELESLLAGWSEDGSAALRSDAAPTAPTAELSQQLFALVAGITGHQPGDLDLDQLLERDLGFDSIRMLELSQSLLQIIPEAGRESCLEHVSTDQLMQARTLREVQEILQPWCVAGGASAAAELAPAVEQSALAVPESEPVPIEILDAQVPFLVGHWAVSTCTLCSHVRVAGNFDLELARRTWTALLARHPALRTYVEIPADAAHFKDYRLMLKSPGPAPQLELTDLRHIERPRQEQMITAHIQQCINEQFSLEQWPLHRFFVWRLAEQVHEVFFLNHHLVSDGLGNQQAIREFLALYESLATGQPADLPPATSVAQYRATVTAMNSWQDAAEEKATADYVRAQGKQSFFWNPSGKPRSTRRALVRQHRFQLEPAAAQALVALTATLRLPMNTLLLGAYLRTLAGFTAAPETFFINVPTSGRVYPHVDAGDMIGCFAQNLTLGLRTPRATEDWAAQLQEVHVQVERALAQGHDRAQIRQTVQFVRDRLRLENGRIGESQCALIRAGMKSNVYLPYIGNTRIGHQYGPLRVLDYQAATVTNGGTLDTVLELFHERLEMTTSYDANTFSPEFVAQVAQAFITQLRNLAAYCPLAAAQQPARLLPTDPMLLSQVRQVAEEIMHQPLRDTDLALDLEADLGLDSLERIRIVARLQQFVPDANRAALLSCRCLNEMLACLADPQVQSAAARACNDTAQDHAKESPAHSPRAELLPTSSTTVQSVPPIPYLPIPYLQVARQCRLTPDALAVLSPEGSLSYADLDRQSNQLACFLRMQGVGRGTLVGIMLHRGPRFMVGWLAVLKAGGAYVPLDPDYPAARLAYIVEHARLETLLTEAQLLGEVERILTPTLPLQRVISLDSAPAALGGKYPAYGRAQWGAFPDLALTHVSTPDDPMVVLYTSGSTGKPKGVVLAHRGYANRLEWHQDLFKLQPGERVAQKTSICFDISVWELLWPLQYGGVVCPVATATLRDPQALAQWVRATAIHVMHFVPSLYGEFLSAIEQQPVEFPALRHLIFSGEALPVAYVRRWMTRFGTRVGLTNLYGPTEASIDVTAEHITSMPPPDAARVPIGKAMPQVHLRVLDEAQRPVPAGTLGELWIGGIQLAQGYLHDPQRTAETFRNNPFPEIPGAALYRTGDLAVELPDGSFDYRGRIDSQVKIRGYRVELGEIEATLSTHPNVREAAVLAIDCGEGNLRLIAWLAGEHCEPRTLREYLGTRLPHYMIPHRFDWLPALPHNQNGKIDRNALKTLHSAPASSSNLAALADTGQKLGPAQQWLLRYFDPPHHWAGFTRFAYLQPLDLEIFNRALKALVEKHPPLQAVFYQHQGAWRQRFEVCAEPADAEYYDGTAVAPEQLEAQVRKLTTERLDKLALGGPLWSALVVKQAESRFEICLLGHHMIGDLLGNSVLFKDLWRFYAELLAGRTLPANGSAASFTNYLAALEQERQPEAFAKHLAYWSARFGSAQAAFQLPFDHQHGENLESSAASEHFTLAAGEYSELQRVRAGHGCPLYSLLLAPLYRVLGEWSGRQRVVLSHRGHGRDLGEGRTYFDAVGNFAVNYPVALELGAQKSWSQLIADVARELQGVPLNGVSYDLVGEQLPLYPDHQITPVRANYLGSRDVPQSRLFEFRSDDMDQRYAAPGQKRTALIEVFFSARDGALQIELSYSRNFHQAATIRRWGERYLALLRDLLRHDAAVTRPAPAGEIRVTVKAAPIVEMKPLNAVAPASKVNGHARLNGHGTQAGPLKTGSSSLAGKVAIVTGAGRGIGLSIALRLATEGARIALVSRSAGPLEQALKEVQAISPESIAITADVTRQDQVESMVERVLAQFGGVDILVNNAGANRSALLAESDPADWRAIVDLNLIAPFLCCRFVVPHLLARGSGKIVNLSSVAGVIGYPLFSAYSAAKHGVLGLTKALAEEVKQRNVQVNAVCPAFVDTRMTPQAFRTLSMPPEQVADVVLFLASPASAGITGESINVFGKQDMHAYGSDKMNVVKAMTKDFRPGVAP